MGGVTHSDTLAEVSKSTSPWMVLVDADILNITTRCEGAKAAKGALQRVSTVPFLPRICQEKSEKTIRKESVTAPRR